MSPDHRAPACPSDVELEAYLHPLAASDSVAYEHVARCPTCQQRLSHLAADAESWSDAQHFLSQPEPDEVHAIVDSIRPLSLSMEYSHGDDPLCEFEIAQLQNLIQPASHPELLGRIGRYELEELVGRGGMGLVFRGRDAELHRIVAIKTLAVHLIPFGAARERFIREARASAALVHPHIVPVYDVITDGAIPALVMQFVAGPTLAGWLCDKGPMHWPDVLQIAIQLCDGLAAAHQHGLVHRDIKPGNVLLEADGSRALLSDFGLVRTLDDASLTRSGMLAGTPDYMSPEQARGEAVDARSDLFSLGSLFYSMLSGHPPFRAPEPMAVLNRICHQRHRSLHTDHPHIPMEISRLVDRLLAKDPRNRPTSAAEVRDQVHRLSLAQLQLRKPWPNWVRQHPWSLATVVLLVTAVIASLSWIGFHGQQSYHAKVDHTSLRIDSTAAVNDGSSDSASPRSSSTSLSNSTISSLASPVIDTVALQQLSQQIQSLELHSRQLVDSWTSSFSEPQMNGAAVHDSSPFNLLDSDLRQLTQELEQLESQLSQP